MQLQALLEARNQGTVVHLLKEFYEENVGRENFAHVDVETRQELVDYIEQEIAKETWNSEVNTSICNALYLFTTDPTNVDVLFHSNNVKRFIYILAKLTISISYSSIVSEHLGGIKCLCNGIVRSPELNASFSEENHLLLKRQLQEMIEKRTLREDEEALYKYQLTLLTHSSIFLKNAEIWLQSDYFIVLTEIIEHAIFLSNSDNSQIENNINRICMIMDTFMCLLARMDDEAISCAKAQHATMVLKIMVKILGASVGIAAQVKESCIILFTQVVLHVQNTNVISQLGHDDMCLVKLCLQKLEETIDNYQADGGRSFVFIQTLLRTCQVNSMIRLYVKSVILPPNKAKTSSQFHDFDVKLQHKLTPIIQARGPLSGVISNLIYTLCNGSKDRLRKYINFAMDAGLLTSLGQLGRITEEEEESEAE